MTDDDLTAPESHRPPPDLSRSVSDEDTIPLRLPMLGPDPVEPVAPPAVPPQVTNGAPVAGGWPPPAPVIPGPPVRHTESRPPLHTSLQPPPRPPQVPPHVPLHPPLHPPLPTPFTRSVPQAPPPELGAHHPQLPSHTELGLIRRAKPAPQSGWRKAVHRLTGFNPGESAQESTRGKLITRVNQPVRGDYSIALLSLKGGVGKTTTTVGLGATFAAIRGDRVIAVDANPDFGTLAQRGPDQSRSTVRDLLLDDNIFRYSDIRRHTSQSSSRLEILASERDPATSEAFSDSDYRGVLRLLQRFYNIILTDCGTGMVHSAMKGVLDEADAIVLVASPAIDAARSALATLDWLEHHGYPHLVPRATVVISAARPGAMSVDIDLLANHFLARVRAVHVIPFDDHLAAGSEIVLDLMAAKTRLAFLELAATIADGFKTKRGERLSPQ